MMWAATGDIWASSATYLLCEFNDSWELIGSNKFLDRLWGNVRGQVIATFIKLETKTQIHYGLKETI